MSISPAALVKAMAGRDKGKYFMVYKVLDPEYVLICDGRRRKISSLKKKKIKHILDLNYSLSLVKEKLDRGIKINNSDIKKSIREGLLELKIF